MAYMKIHCGYCGQSWDVYQRDDWNKKNAATCPHCFKRIDWQTWSNHVLPAFGAAIDGNMELFKDHTGYHLPVFTFDIIADHIFPGALDDLEVD